jgi:8-oxo-dGTP diphosphatase
MEPGISVRGFVINNEKLLLMKRRNNDVHCADQWEIPGGRLENGEDPYKGLKREVQEEAGITATVLLPMSINYYVREDGQTITGIVFACKTDEATITLSEEHSEYKWVSLEEAKKLIFDPMKKEIDRFEELDLKEKIDSLSEPKYKLM